MIESHRGGSRNLSRMCNAAPPFTEENGLSLSSRICNITRRVNKRRKRFAPHEWNAATRRAAPAGFRQFRDPIDRGGRPAENSRVASLARAPDQGSAATRRDAERNASPPTRRDAPGTRDRDRERYDTLMYM